MKHTKVIAQQAMKPSIMGSIANAGVIAVLVIDELAHAVPVAKALLKGGVNAIELTLRTEVALDAGRAIKEAVPEIILGFGTVLTADQVDAVADIGADFAVAPGCNPRVITAARERVLSFAPGVMTPSDIEIAIEQGCRVLKYFPAETSGGITHLQSMSAPYQYLGLQFIPLGGVNMQNAQSYLKSPLVSAIGGSWLAKRPLIQAENWEAITANAQQVNALVKELKDTKTSRLT